MTLGEIIRTNREALGMTQEQLAEKLHVTPVVVSKWENNHWLPCISNRKKLAELFRLDLKELNDAANHNHSSSDSKMQDPQQPIEVPNPQDNQLEANQTLKSLSKDCNCRKIYC